LRVQKRKPIFVVNLRKDKVKRQTQKRAKDKKILSSRGLEHRFHRQSLLPGFNRDNKVRSLKTREYYFLLATQSKENSASFSRSSSLLVSGTHYYTAPQRWRAEPVAYPRQGWYNIK
jgi:hypothetical protein